ncbi:MAG: hypothetical protein ACE5HO_17130 [bacterium]
MLFSRKRFIKRGNHTCETWPEFLFGKIQGKLHYLAPEQINDHTVRTDVFACRLLLYELLTGERLIQSESPQEILETIRLGKWDLSALDNPSVPQKLKETDTIEKPGYAVEFALRNMR